jgi:carboxypeptidase Q
MKTSLTFTLALATMAYAAAQSNPADIQRIIDEGKNRNQVMRTLHSLTYVHGPRLTGSPKLLQAQNWAVAELKRYGIANARLEKWGEVPVGFQRGSRQHARMVAPFNVPITFTTPNWMPGTNGLVRADAVHLPKDMGAYALARGSFKGKWVVVSSTAGMRGANLPEGPLKEALDAEGVAGYIFGTADDRVHSHGNWRGKTYENRPKDVVIIVSKDDHDRIVRNIDFGRKTTLEFDIENLWFKGPIPQYNVVADIVGTEKPDEIVIICGHIDSWNSPGSHGACDNGTGSAVAIEAARILMRTGMRPKRTIRIVLFGGEEQGLLGSRGYVETHRDKLQNIVAVLNDDGGTNYQGGYSGIASMKEIMERAFAPTVAAFPDLPMSFRTVPQMPSGGSSDHAPFIWEGIPAFFTVESGRANYGKVWHTQYDVYEEAIPEYLFQSSTNHAVVAYNLATIAERLPNFPKPDRATAYNGKDGHTEVHEIVGADATYFDPHQFCDHDDDFVQENMDRAWRFWRRLTRS